MAKLYEYLEDAHVRFIENQPVFFVASAANQGSINLSPKGMDTFRCLDKRTVSYLDLTGSGNETAAHLRENGRLTIMFCSFGSSPQIMRLRGEGRVVGKASSEWADLAKTFPTLPGTRQIVILAIQSVQTSCGFAVPQMELIAERPVLTQWAEKRGPDGIEAYWQEKNQRSLDGLDTGIDKSLPPVERNGGSS